MGGPAGFAKGNNLSRIGISFVPLGAFLLMAPIDVNNPENAKQQKYPAIADSSCSAQATR